ncbi:MAG: hypothetical protein BI182_08400 [Acetobacterium sp. MES1]|uniref:hypothetical protein n=1 Tax=Acetobacterium sp. MES1 TaxID=1899015 RepID=UPI000B9CB85F|nr:hypothetical protein [Acetobacterium sp. MES1]OXS26405.1 MAG: hypothetical protein BI182_08400 [Acetobacterium sp. MES1]
MSYTKTNDDGLWEVDGFVEVLIEPSEVFIEKRKIIDEEREQQKILDSLIPNEKEILMAEIEIQTIQILQEGGLL